MRYITKKLFPQQYVLRAVILSTANVASLESAGEDFSSD